MKRIQLIGIALILVISISMVAYASDGVGKYCIDFTDWLYQEFGLVVPQDECVTCKNSSDANFPVCLCKYWQRLGVLDGNFGQCVKIVTQIMH